MPMLPYDPFKDTEQLRKEMHKYIHNDGFFDKYHETGPKVDIFETGDDIVVTFEIPGVENKEDIDIHINHNELHVSGRISQAHHTNEVNYHLKERRTGYFNRIITLPAMVSGQAHARYKNGVLEIIMKKAKTNKEKIDVEFH